MFLRSRAQPLCSYSARARPLCSFWLGPLLLHLGSTPSVPAGQDLNPMFQQTNAWPLCPCGPGNRAQQLCSCGPVLCPFVPEGLSQDPLFLRAMVGLSVPAGLGRYPLFLSSRARPLFFPAGHGLDHLFLRAWARTLGSLGPGLRPFVP